MQLFKQKRIYMNDGFSDNLFQQDANVSYISNSIVSCNDD